jgi:hypothetical protein
MKWLKTFESYSYRIGDVFTDYNQKKLCQNLYKIGKWLVDDYGLKEVINELLSKHKITDDSIDEYQDALKILKETGRFDDIFIEDGIYKHEKFKSTSLVYDINGEYHYVNKLNTNRGDLSELLTKIIFEKNLGYVSNYTEDDLKEFLIKHRNIIVKYIEKEFNIDDIKEFTRNSKSNTEYGEKVEKYVESILNKSGFTTVIQSKGDGDFIDMIFGIDLIMDYKGRIILCQVKPTVKQSISASENNYYRRIDYFISPVSGIGSDIIIYNRKGDSFIINKNGELVK